MLTPPPFFLGRPVGGYDEFVSCLNFHGSHTLEHIPIHWNTAVNEGEDRRVDDFGRTLGGHWEDDQRGSLFFLFLLDD